MINELIKLENGVYEITSEEYLRCMSELGIRTYANDMLKKNSILLLRNNLFSAFTIESEKKYLSILDGGKRQNILSSDPYSVREELEEECAEILNEYFKYLTKLKELSNRIKAAGGSGEICENKILILNDYELEVYPEDWRMRIVSKKDRFRHEHIEKTLIDVLKNTKIQEIGNMLQQYRKSKIFKIEEEKIEKTKNTRIERIRFSINREKEIFETLRKTGILRKMWFYG